MTRKSRSKGGGGRGARWQPETHGVAERFSRTSEEQATHGRIFQTIEDVRKTAAKFV